MQTGDKKHSNKNEQYEQETNVDDHAYAGEQEDPDTTIHMDVFEEQETNIQGVEQGIKINSDNSNQSNLKTEVITLNLNKPVSVHDKRNNAVVVDMRDVPEMCRSMHTVQVNYLGGSQHQNPTHTNRMWLKNQPAPPQVNWTEWWQGNQYPEGFVGPLNYTPRARNSFVRLVLTIVFIMLLATSGILAYVWTTPDIKEYFQISGWAVVLPALIVFIAVDYAMICSPCSRVLPCSFILLLLTVLCMSVIAAKITVHYKTEVILYAFLSTAVVVLFCLLLACSNFDFTSWILYVVVIMVAFSVIAMIVMIMMMLGTVIKPVLIGVLVIGTLLQVVALTIQLQMILGGKAIELSEEDYALGAFMLYTSILDIFLKMVQIIGLSSE